MEVTVNKSNLYLFLLFLVIIIGGSWFMMRMPGLSYHGPLAPLTTHEQQLRDELKKHVQYLAGDLGPRNIWHKSNLDAAERYINKQFTNIGLEVSEQTYTVNNTRVSNIIGEKRGDLMPENIIIVGAHYDTVFDSPGADDNASGVAAMLSIANAIKNKSLPYTIRFIAFVNEESPFFYTPEMGSWQYAKMMRKKQENIIGMFSLESLGYYSTQRNSQHYPILLGLFYPHTGNFIGFIGNLSSRSLVHTAIASFRKHTKFPSEGIAGPRFIPGISWSDQWAFWKHGYKGVMITTTAPYRNPHYHQPSDLPKTLDYDRTARVVSGLIKVFLELSQNSRN